MAALWWGNYLGYLLLVARSGRGEMSSIELKARGSKGPSVVAPAIDYVVICGRRLNLDELFTSEHNVAPITSPRSGAEFRNNKPFQHIVIDGLFNEELLSLVEEEFPASGTGDWKNLQRDCMILRIARKAPI